MIRLKYCPNCGSENEEDAVFCKICAFRFDNESIYDNNKDKVVTKTKTKVKRKGGKDRTKVKYKEGKIERRMSFFEKFMMFFFILLCIALIGACGILAYHIYETENIEVPDVLGETYDGACKILKSSNLNCSEVLEETDDEDEVGIVLKQSKRGGSKAAENAIIKLTVGVLDTHVVVPDVEGMSLEDALVKLNEASVNYKLEYEETDDKDNIVLKQSVKAFKKIENTDVVTLTIARLKEQPEEDADNTNSSDTNEGNSTDTDSSDLVN